MDITVRIRVKLRQEFSGTAIRIIESSDNGKFAAVLDGNTVALCPACQNKGVSTAAADIDRLRNTVRLLGITGHLVYGCVQFRCGCCQCRAPGGSGPASRMPEVTVIDKIVPAGRGCLFYLHTVNIHRAGARSQNMRCQRFCGSCSISNFQPGPITVCRKDFSINPCASIPPSQISRRRTGFHISREGITLSCCCAYRAAIYTCGRACGAPGHF